MGLGLGIRGRLGVEMNDTVMYRLSNAGCDVNDKPKLAPKSKPDPQPKLLPQPEPKPKAEPQPKQDPQPNPKL